MTLPGARPTSLHAPPPQTCHRSGRSGRRESFHQQYARRAQSPNQCGPNLPFPRSHIAPVRSTIERTTGAHFPSISSVRDRTRPLKAALSTGANQLTIRMQRALGAHSNEEQKIPAGLLPEAALDTLGPMRNKASVAHPHSTTRRARGGPGHERCSHRIRESRGGAG